MLPASSYPPLVRGVRGVETDGNVSHFVHVDVFLGYLICQGFVITKSNIYKLVELNTSETFKFNSLSPGEATKSSLVKLPISL